METKYDDCPEEPTYKGAGKHKWHRVSANTSRMRVPGGWLYRVIVSFRPSVTFVPYN
jgi:hypothetical protein